MQLDAAAVVVFGNVVRDRDVGLETVPDHDATRGVVESLVTIDQHIVDRSIRRNTALAARATRRIGIHLCAGNGQTIVVVLGANTTLIETNHAQAIDIYVLHIGRNKDARITGQGAADDGMHRRVCARACATQRQ